jgi:hypothetical protein
MIYRQYRQRVTYPPGSKVAVTEQITEDITGNVFTVTSDVRGIVLSRAATSDETQWETDQTIEQDAQTSEQAALDRLDFAANVLRQWSSDAAGVVAAWDSASDLQKDQWTKATIDRLGKLTDNLADVLIQLGVRRNI